MPTQTFLNPVQKQNFDGGRGNEVIVYFFDQKKTHADKIRRKQEN
jgi:hypothetical protein